jgi:hypothetical protein
LGRDWQAAKTLRDGTEILRERSRLPPRLSPRAREEGVRASRLRARSTGIVAHLLTSLRHPPNRVAQEQADRRFPRLAIPRGRLGVTGPAGSMNYGTTPRGLCGQARTADHPQKRTSAPFALSLGARGIHRQIKRLGENPVSLEGDKLEVAVKTAAGCSRSCPRARDRRPNCSFLSQAAAAQRRVPLAALRDLNARAVARWLASRGRPHDKRHPPGPRPTLGQLQGRRRRPTRPTRRV